MYDRYERHIDYLRISVTDRCNLRCIYCMPAEGIQLLRHEDILSFDEITEVARIAVEMGVRKIRLTGGEPLVRRGITELVKMIAGIAGIEDLSGKGNILEMVLATVSSHEVIAALVTGGILVDEARIQRRSLEDIYLDVMRQAEGGDP